MNLDTHRLVFNKARGCIMAVSEAANTCCKSASGSTTTRRRSRRKGCHAEVYASNRPAALMGGAQAAMNSIANHVTIKAQGNLGTNAAARPGAMVQVTSTVGTSAQVVRSLQINTTLPNNSLFRLNPGPGSNYLVETDPRFASYRTWLSSDYLLGARSVDPTPHPKTPGRRLL